MNIHPSFCESSPLHWGEQDDIDTNYWPQPEGNEDHAWTAWYRDDEPDYDGFMRFGNGSTQLRAIDNLRIRFPRED